ncbi:MAG: hypothetical protein ACM3ZQ_11940, partial [Bacillota bacterium]
ALPVEIIVTAHSGLVDRQLIDDTIGYLQALRDHQPTELGEKMKGLHAYNRNHVLVLSYEQQARAKLGRRFDFGAFMRGLGQRLGAATPEQLARRIRSANYEEIKQVVASYVAELS